VSALPVVFVAFDGVQSIDVAGPYEVFASAGDAAASLGRRAGYWVRVASAHGGPVRAESGLELRLTELLADRTAAHAAQLMIEYDPQPPFDCGARPKAGEEVMARAWQYGLQRS
jgi:transcriptional regulator GlxA family with amidase domain